jgi:hypothetical protein
MTEMTVTFLRPERRHLADVGHGDFRTMHDLQRFFSPQCA